MSKLLATASHKGILYQFFSDEYNKVKVKIFGNNIDIEESKSVINSIIKEINNRSKIFIGDLKFENELLSMYRNEITDFVYFKKDGKVIDVNDPKYYDLYHKYNFTVYAYGYNSSYEYNPDFEFEDDFSSFYRSQEINRKNKRKRKIKAIIGSSVIGVSILLGSFGLWHHIKDNKLLPNDDDIEISSVEIYGKNDELTDDLSGIHFGFVNDEKSVEDQIREQLKDEEDWVIEEVLKEYRFNQAFMQALDNGENPDYLFETEPEIQIDYSTLSEKTLNIFNIIKNNDYIKPEFKESIMKNYASYFESRMKNISDAFYKRICDRIATLSIVEDYRDAGHIVLSDGFQAGGQYFSGSNEIFLYNDREQTLMHEFNHVLGNLYVEYREYDKLNEGCTEYTNPCRESQIYEREQLFFLIFEQIYGRDLMQKSYYNGGIRFQIQEQYGEYSGLDKETFEMVNEYLRNIQFLGDKEVEGVAEQTNAVIGKLRELYEIRTGLSFDENPVIKVCLAVLLKDNSLLELSDEYEIIDIAVEDDGSCKYKISKPINYSYTIENSIVSEFTTVSKEVIVK